MCEDTAVVPVGIVGVVLLVAPVRSMALSVIVVFVLLVAVPLGMTSSNMSPPLLLVLLVVVVAGKEYVAENLENLLCCVCLFRMDVRTLRSALSLLVSMPLVADCALYLVCKAEGTETVLLEVVLTVTFVGGLEAGMAIYQYSYR
jgi:hypothetical protein